MPLLYETHEGVTRLTLNRPDKRNALSPELIQALITALERAKEDPLSRVVILSGRGQHFCAGADLTQMAAMAKASLEENTQDAHQLATLLYHLYHFPKPTLAQVQGATYGGGIGLIAACDMAIAEAQATFCFSEVKLGLIPAVISPFVLQAMGPRAALPLWMTAEPFDATTAQALQLLHTCVPAEYLSDHATQQAQRLAALPSHALHACKALARAVATQAITPSLMKQTAAWLAQQRQHLETP